jgi:hypothetical protein
MRACVGGRTRCLGACASSGGDGVEGSLLASNREANSGGVSQRSVRTCHRTVIARALVPRCVLSITNSGVVREMYLPFQLCALKARFK